MKKYSWATRIMFLTICVCVSSMAISTNNLDAQNKKPLIEMVLIQGGTFQMGSINSEPDEKPVHEVTVDDFYIGKYEVTQWQWQAVMGNNPAKFQKGNDYPVEQVSWKDCQEFIKRLNEKTGLLYRLPTEAEWEYACRAGTSGDRYGNLNEIAWYWDNSSQSPHIVGQKEPNAFGLYDTLGNVWEWCQDCYNYKYYASSPVHNPVCSSSDVHRILRGGSFRSPAEDVRSARRIRYDQRLFNMGFRLAMDK